MTKDYHITLEQAMKLAESAGFVINAIGELTLPAPKEDAKELIQKVINAALDKVLGEPVAWAEAGREHNVIADLVKQTNKNGWVKPYTVALYAPRREK